MALLGVAPLPGVTVQSMPTSGMRPVVSPRAGLKVNSMQAFAPGFGRGEGRLCRT
jgi:hypothetical protein